MAHYVLVHGLGLGGWCWRRVADRLREAGHSVFTPSLTGLAERRHLASPEVDLQTHIEDVARLIEWEDLHDVFLVGHSYGGAVVTGAADRVPERIGRLIYLDAFILRNGESVLSLQPPGRVAYYEKLVAEEGAGWLLPPNSAAFYGLTDPEDQEWVDARSRPHPFATIRQPIQLRTTAKPTFPRSYIWASDFAQGPFARFAERVRDDPSWDYREISGGHLLMVSHPDQVANALLDTA